MTKVEVIMDGTVIKKRIETNDDGSKTVELHGRNGIKTIKYDKDGKRIRGKMTFLDKLNKKCKKNEYTKVDNNIVSKNTLKNGKLWKIMQYTMNGTPLKYEEYNNGVVEKRVNYNHGKMAYWYQDINNDGRWAYNIMVTIENDKVKSYENLSNGNLFRRDRYNDRIEDVIMDKNKMELKVVYKEKPRTSKRRSPSMFRSPSPVRRAEEMNPVRKSPSPIATHDLIRLPSPAPVLERCASPMKEMKQDPVNNNGTSDSRTTMTYDDVRQLYVHKIHNKDGKLHGEAGYYEVKDGHMIKRVSYHDGDITRWIEYDNYGNRMFELGIKCNTANKVNYMGVSDRPWINVDNIQNGNIKVDVDKMELVHVPQMVSSTYGSDGTITTYDNVRNVYITRKYNEDGKLHGDNAYQEMKNGNIVKSVRYNNGVVEHWTEYNEDKRILSFTIKDNTVVGGSFTDIQNRSWINLSNIYERTIKVDPIKMELIHVPQPATQDVNKMELIHVPQPIIQDERVKVRLFDHARGVDITKRYNLDGELHGPFAYQEVKDGYSLKKIDYDNGSIIRWTEYDKCKEIVNLNVKNNKVTGGVFVHNIDKKWLTYSNICRGWVVVDVQKMELTLKDHIPSPSKCGELKKTCTQSFWIKGDKGPSSDKGDSLFTFKEMHPNGKIKKITKTSNGLVHCSTGPAVIEYDCNGTKISERYFADGVEYVK